MRKAYLGCLSFLLTLDVSTNTREKEGAAQVGGKQKHTVYDTIRYNAYDDPSLSAHLTPRCYAKKLPRRRTCRAKNKRQRACPMLLRCDENRREKTEGASFPICVVDARYNHGKKFFVGISPPKFPLLFERRPEI